MDVVIPLDKRHGLYLVDAGAASNVAVGDEPPEGAAASSPGEAPDAALLSSVGRRVAELFAWACEHQTEQITGFQWVPGIPAPKATAIKATAIFGIPGEDGSNSTALHIDGSAGGTPDQAYHIFWSLPGVIARIVHTGSGRTGLLDTTAGVANFGVDGSGAVTLGGAHWLGIRTLRGDGSLASIYPMSVSSALAELTGCLNAVTVQYCPHLPAIANGAAAAENTATDE